jgi:hypothetical protein
MLLASSCQVWAYFALILTQRSAEPNARGKVLIPEIFLDCDQMITITAHKARTSKTDYDLSVFRMVHAVTS